MDVQELVDRAEIHDLLARYTYGLDFSQWDMVGSSFTDDGVYDMHDYFARLGLDIEPARGREAIVGGLQAAVASDAAATLQHFFTNMTVDLHGDDADVTTYLIVHTSREGHTFLTGAVWEDRLRRTDDGWRIAYRYLRFVWERGRPMPCSVRCERRHAARVEGRLRTSRGAAATGARVPIAPPGRRRRVAPRSRSGRRCPGCARSAGERRSRPGAGCGAHREAVGGW